ncbi:hypothetical protein CJD36_021335 [Flavipsychrobacter stenotrophus]|uniref:Uncharacterized protein n=1 Tax=Flavipsychrobacter stenotrophus TaxID=2077091 RepID=A0A2S7SQS0_9BACT|nr:SprT-like domain-containing protein [Flavipsychrobacter stenotrophus]PQJ08955.1 hypothetical protein CJD36_021335 [Flavipsychrobacter stenotrophus]
MRHKILVLLALCVSQFCNGQVTQLHYSGNNKKIAFAVEAANKILRDPSFYNRIDTIARFDNSEYSGHRIVNEFQKLGRVIEVTDYWRPIAWANAKTVTKIKINSAKLRRSHSSITNTLIHETVHAVDWITNGEWNYTHSGNSPEGQSATAPWIIGSIAESMVNK